MPSGPRGGHGPQGKTPEQVFLGQLALRRKRGVIKVPAQWLRRLRHTPFFNNQEQRVQNWIGQANHQITEAAGSAPDRTITAQSSATAQRER
jgi:hypothetical protein